MFECPICNETLYYCSLCDKCEKIKNIAKCYSIDKMIEVLERVFLREDDKCENKTILEFKNKYDLRKVKE